MPFNLTETPKHLVFKILKKMSPFAMAKAQVTCREIAILSKNLCNTTSSKHNYLHYNLSFILRVDEIDKELEVDCEGHWPKSGRTELFTTDEEIICRLEALTLFSINQISFEIVIEKKAGYPDFSVINDKIHAILFEAIRPHFPNHLVNVKLMRWVNIMSRGIMDKVLAEKLEYTTNDMPYCISAIEILGLPGVKRIKDVSLHLDPHDDLLALDMAGYERLTFFTKQVDNVALKLFIDEVTKTRRVDGLKYLKFHISSEVAISFLNYQMENFPVLQTALACFNTREGFEYFYTENNMLAHFQCSNKDCVEFYFCNTLEEMFHAMIESMHNVTKLRCIDYASLYRTFMRVGDINKIVNVIYIMDENELYNNH